MWQWSKLSSVKWLDAWEERFYGNPNSVINEIKGGKSIRVEIYCDTEAEALAIKKQFGGAVRQLKMENWAAMNDQPKPPLKIRDALVITGSRDAKVIERLREDYPKRHLIKMPAEMAFGTGDHATTSTCLRFLVDIAREKKGTEWEMLDLGCGTSVLAIAARMMGAKAAEAHDFDPQAVRVSKHNLKLNEIKGIKVLEKDVLKWTPERQWEVVAANLFSSILQEAFPTIVKAMVSGGDLVISGILKDQWEETKAVAGTNGLEFNHVVTKGKWVGARAKKV